VEISSKIYIAGSAGMVGSAILRNLESKGYSNFVFTPYPEYDLTNQKTVEDFFRRERPDYVINAAAKVGGILANDTYRAQFIYENLMIQNNIIHNAHVFGAKKLLFLGSSCIYPRGCPQPMKEEYLLTGLLEPTNEPYAIAKIAGIKMCENYHRQYGSNFISVMPTNLFGPNDNFDLETSHVLPALIRKLHLAKCLSNRDWESIRKDFNKRPIKGIDGSASEEQLVQVLKSFGLYVDESPQKNGFLPTTSRLLPTVVTLWGTGNPKREFLYVDDMADACVHLMDNLDAEELYSSGVSHINIGIGEDFTIAGLSEAISSIIGYKGRIEYDTSKPDGTPRKLLDVSRLHTLGWQSRVALEKRINETYNWYVENE
jgi:GDP-L-fucose synthase